MAHVPIEERARRIVHFASAERRLFEIVGAWVPVVADPQLKVLLRSQSFDHGRHSDEWSKLVPGLAHLPAPPVQPPSSGDLLALVATLEEAHGSAVSTVNVKTLYGSVVPSLISSYEVELAETSPMADGPLQRWLTQVVAEERRHLAEAEALVGAAWHDIH